MDAIAMVRSMRSRSISITHREREKYTGFSFWCNKEFTQKKKTKSYPSLSEDNGKKNGCLRKIFHDDDDDDKSEA